MQNIVDMDGASYQQTGALKVYQSGPMQAASMKRQSVNPAPYVAQVVKVHTDRNTCDIATKVEKTSNVPILCKTGKDSDNKIWGEVEFPQEGDWVIVLPLDSFNQKKLIIGSLMPYLMSAYQSQQIPVNSTNKSYTKKLLEANLDTKTFRKIFRSGTTIEVKADGSVIVETPSGTLLKLDESAGSFSIEDSNGNTIVSSATKLTINNHFEVTQ